MKYIGLTFLILATSVVTAVTTIKLSKNTPTSTKSDDELEESLNYVNRAINAIQGKVFDKY